MITRKENTPLRMWLVINKNTSNKPKSFRCPGCPPRVGTPNLRILTITFPRLLNSPGCLFTIRTSSYDICKTCYLWSPKGKTQKHCGLLLFIYLNIFNFPPRSQTLGGELWMPSLLSRVTYYHSPFSLCTQVTIYVKLAFPPSPLPV